jgi:signal transduction histidine kinase
MEKWIDAGLRWTARVVASNQIRNGTESVASPMQRKPSAPPPADQGAGARAAPRLTIDAAQGAIVAANAQGWEAWGLDSASAAAPLAIDRAMPALVHLVALAGDCRARKQAKEVLAFWTSRGLRLWRCRVRPSDAARCAFDIEVLGAAADGDGPRGLVSRAPVQDASLTRELAHELRTPLSAVIAYAEILKDEHFGPMANPRYRDYAANIYDSARHALGVVDGMVDSGAGHCDTSQLAFRDLDPGTIVEHCMAVARPLAAEAGLELSAEVAERAPRIIADEVSLKQMLLNLLTNAIKFTRAGDTVTVGVSYEPGGPLSIAVTDTGPGMSEPPLALHGGRPGRRTRSLRNAGRGIGLPLTRALAEANGASLVIDSMPGRGTRATIAFNRDRVVPV